ncbi:hypothetical protein QUF74_17850 [Candidatus Halobeggiatoa sp. HSG11]|nr:hypothetical protein [Candidatus Halobeggiatoa sp. HSG11]
MLRDNLKYCVAELQKLLEEHQDDDKLIEAAENKWPDERNILRNLIIASGRKDVNLRGSLPTEEGGPGSEDDENTVTNKNPN